MHPLDAFLLSEGDDVVWEAFHENSKTSRVEPHLYFERHPSDQTIVTMMRGLREVKPYADRAKVALPEELGSMRVSLEDALTGRESAREFGPGPVSLGDVGTILRCAQGVTRDNVDTSFPRPFRSVPSGGALYPLEVYVWARSVTDLPTGLYHYDPHDHDLDVLGDVDIDDAFVQQDLVESAAAVVLVSAVFFRSVFKYGERGYRFVLLEAGHLVQNALLAARGRELAAVPIGGYFDREVDRALGFDGLHESVVYAMLVGRPVSA
ncbi:SagB family peptide dehydrogenase [Actinopolymorpha pittospori]|uniref:SagB-type dehydrogenase family enzyme n=1 Tax=Actinopolymorpha pittospori TaxID=648752 RepID=A0A927MYY6_9ACTN|nr:SagB-type dehydrogenase family enzyme [Actinopolymorpha pittospori]